MIKSHLRNQRDVRVIGEARDMFGRIIARPPEPTRSIDSVLQMLRAGKRRLHIGSPILCAVVLWVLSCSRNRKGKKNCKKAESNTQGNPPRIDNALTIPREGAQDHCIVSSKQNGSRF